MRIGGENRQSSVSNFRRHDTYIRKSSGYMYTLQNYSAQVRFYMYVYIYIYVCVCDIRGVFGTERSKLENLWCSTHITHTSQSAIATVFSVGGARPLIPYTESLEFRNGQTFVARRGRARVGNA